jgi:hypothetical protein
LWFRDDLKTSIFALRCIYTPYEVYGTIALEAPGAKKKWRQFWEQEANFLNIGSIRTEEFNERIEVPKPRSSNPAERM